MSDKKRTWKNVNKRKKKRPYKNHNKPFKLSQNDFPSLNSEYKGNPNNNFKLQNTYSSLVWRKNSDNSLKNTIYTKAKNGALLFHSYPVLDNTLHFPLFQ